MSKDPKKATSPFPNHAGKATWGERLVPIEDFAREVQQHGRALDPAERAKAIAAFGARGDDGVAPEGPFQKVALCGGIYSNHYALQAFLTQSKQLGVDAIYCLGDLGGFGPHPDRVWPLLTESGVRCIQGNYEQSLSGGAEDCNCGYTDPRDNYYAELSYSYTDRRTSPDFKAWMGTLPLRRRFRLADRDWLVVHGSPRRINEFLFESTSPAGYLEKLLDDEGCQGLLFTHTGLHWKREVAGGRWCVNVGVLGRPANDGTTRVWFTTLAESDGEVAVEHHPLEYDHSALIAEMRAEALPEPFIETIGSGWWTTCLEILPARERKRSRL